MDSIRSLHPMAKAWLLDGALSPYVDALEALLERGRYADGTVATDLCAVAHFAHWMTRCRLTADQIDEALVEQLLDSHPARCDCHATAPRTHGDLRAAARHRLGGAARADVRSAAGCRRDPSGGGRYARGSGPAWLYLHRRGHHGAAGAPHRQGPGCPARPVQPARTRPARGGHRCGRRTGCRPNAAQAAGDEQGPQCRNEAIEEQRLAGHQGVDDPHGVPRSFGQASSTMSSRGTAWQARHVVPSSGSLPCR